MLKRLIDFILALVGILLLWPVILVAAVVVRCGSPGPAIFVQMRVGRCEQQFSCYKIRTMYVGTNDLPSHEVGISSITSAGRILRNTKLDELPQLLNVVRGEMSLVGPRPCLPTQRLLIDERRREGVFNIRPGITGLAQVRGVDMSDPVKLARVDGTYAREQTLTSDMRILIATLTGSGMDVDRAEATDKPRDSAQGR